MDIHNEAKQYTSSFYKGHEKGSYDSAKVILPIVNKLIQPKSVIDVGCGIGLWLKVWKEDYNIEDIKGIEGAYVNDKMFSLPSEYIQIHDLKTPLNSSRKYDIAMSMEVAEHLPEANAAQFIQTLTSLSDVILFSAAMIGQEGTYHLNEQMPEYWAKKFAKHNYVPIDYIRPLVWNDDKVMYWYKQNVLLFVKKDIINNLPPELIKAYEQTNPDCLLRVHPYQYFRVYNRRNLLNFIHYRLYRIKKFIKEK